MPRTGQVWPFHGTMELEGTFTLRSEPRAGTTETLWLPVSGGDPGNVVEDAIPPMATVGRQMLAGDDDPPILMNMAAFLKDTSHQAREAGSGGDALAMACISTLRLANWSEFQGMARGVLKRRSRGPCGTYLLSI